MLLNSSLNTKITKIINVHKELHGIDGVVDYAIVNDVMRREEFREVKRSDVEDVVANYLHYFFKGR